MWQFCQTCGIEQFHMFHETCGIVQYHMFSEIVLYLIYFSNMIDWKMWYSQFTSKTSRTILECKLWTVPKLHRRKLAFISNIYWSFWTAGQVNAKNIISINPALIDMLSSASNLCLNLNEIHCWLCTLFLHMNNNT